MTPPLPAINFMMSIIIWSVNFFFAISNVSKLLKAAFYRNVVLKNVNRFFIVIAFTLIQLRAILKFVYVCWC